MNAAALFRLAYRVTERHFHALHGGAFFERVRRGCAPGRTLFCIQLLSRQALELFAGENYNVPCGGVLRSIEKERRRHNETREGAAPMNKILIIDDDRELCALLKRSILSENIEADCCSTGKEGLRKLKEKEYQLVILDVMMPGMDGFETLEEIRKTNY